MPSGEGIGDRGFDGVVVAEDGHAFCPDGLSIWELSTSANVWRKLGKDFDKRLSASLDPGRATYVGVSARRLDRAKKDAWLAERRATSGWRDIAILDSENLAQWLNSAPAVARWFAGELDRPTTEIRDVERFLKDWSERTERPLPWTLLLAGNDRTDATQEVTTWLERPPSSLRIRAERPEEGLLFVSAAIANSTESDREKWLARTLIVETPAAWRWLTERGPSERRDPLVLLAAFPPPISIPKGPFHVGIPLSLTQDDSNALTLPEIPWGRIQEELRGAGWTDREAERLARESGGRLGALQRLLGDVEVPAWAEAYPLSLLLALLLTGAFQPDIDADREIIRRLDADPDELDRLCGALSVALDAPIVSDAERWQRPAWRWASAKDAWRAFGRKLTSRQLDRFLTVAMDVFGVSDPRYDRTKPVSPDEVFVAQLKEPTSSATSGALRVGLLETIARLGNEENAPASAVSYAERLVVNLLTPNWKRWASLSSSLPLLSEAAPERFMDALEDSLRAGEEGVAYLLREDPAWSDHPHTGLLWALEGLARHPKLFLRAGIALAHLSRWDVHFAKERNSNYANRPIRSLDQIANAWIPHSASDVDDRVQLLEHIFKLEPDIARTLALSMLPSLAARVMHQSHRPTIASWDGTPDTKHPPPKDQRKQEQAALSLVLRHAGTSPDAWKDIVDSLRGMPGFFASQILQALERAKGSIADPAGEIWKELRDALHLTYLRREELKRADYVAHLHRLYSAFEPEDLVSRFGWLFAGMPALPVPRIEDFNEQERRAEEERQRALAEIFSRPEHWSVVGRLANAIANPGILGWSLGQSAFADESEIHFMSDGVGDERKCMPAFVAKRTADKGEQWRSELLEQLVANRRVDDAIQIAVGQYPVASLWDLVERLGPQVNAGYWKNVHGIYGERTADELDRVIRQLLAVGRVATALDAASAGREIVKPETVSLVLDAFQTAASSPEFEQIVNSSTGYHLMQVLAVLDADPTIDVQRVISYEMFLFRLLEHSGRKLRLFDVLADSPAQFAEVISWVYRSDKESPKEPDDRRRALASLGWHVLEEWPTYPGSDLPTEQREDSLFKWATEALRITREQGRAAIGSHEVAKVLARAPAAAEDSLWPCLAARRLLEAAADNELAQGLAMAEHNSRGVTTRGFGEGGTQERNLAERYRDSAARLRREWPRTARTLDEIAKSYESDADSWDLEARGMRRRYGIDRPEKAPSMSQPQLSESTPTGVGGASEIQSIDMRNVGPAERLKFKLSPRLNLLVGDNGAGKTFVLDVLFWALTGEWPGNPAFPRDEGPAATIEVETVGGKKAVSSYDVLSGLWTRPEWPADDPLVIYARVDGSFAVWDPLRRKSEVHASAELWERPTEDKLPFLMATWSDWQFRRRGTFDLFQRVLAALSTEDEPITAGTRYVRVWPKLRVECPTIEMPYGAVPITHAAAGLKRILGLAFFIVLAYQGHIDDADRAGQPRARRLVLIVDEVEGHLHPKWQRVLLPALLRVLKDISTRMDVQVVATTHSPMVTASVEAAGEAAFAPATDRITRFSIDGASVVAEEVPWAKQGDATNWLVSESFGLKQARSKEAERAIEVAEAFMREEGVPPEFDSMKKIHAELLRVLPSHDPFWPRWLVTTGQVQ